MRCLLLAVACVVATGEWAGADEKADKLKRADAELLKLWGERKRSEASKLIMTTLEPYLKVPAEEIPAQDSVGVAKFYLRLYHNGADQVTAARIERLATQGGVEASDYKAWQKAVVEESYAAIKRGEAGATQETPKPAVEISESLKKALSSAEKAFEKIEKDEPEATKAKLKKLADIGDVAGQLAFDQVSKGRPGEVGGKAGTCGAGVNPPRVHGTCHSEMHPTLKDESFQKVMGKLNPDATASDLVRFAVNWSVAMPTVRELAVESYLAGSPNPAPQTVRFMKSITK